MEFVRKCDKLKHWRCPTQRSMMWTRDTRKGNLWRSSSTSGRRMRWRKASIGSLTTWCQIVYLPLPNEKRLGTADDRCFPFSRESSISPRQSLGNDLKALSILTVISLGGELGPDHANWTRPRQGFRHSQEFCDQRHRRRFWKTLQDQFL